jgi:hypothetical protein
VYPAGYGPRGSVLGGAAAPVADVGSVGGPDDVRADLEFALADLDDAHHESKRLYRLLKYEVALRLAAQAETERVKARVARLEEALGMEDVEEELEVGTPERADVFGFLESARVELGWMQGEIDEEEAQDVRDRLERGEIESEREWSENDPEGSVDGESARAASADPRVVDVEMDDNEGEKEGEVSDRAASADPMVSDHEEEEEEENRRLAKAVAKRFRKHMRRRERKRRLVSEIEEDLGVVVARPEEGASGNPTKVRKEKGRNKRPEVKSRKEAFKNALRLKMKNRK